MSEIHPFLNCKTAKKTKIADLQLTLVGLLAYTITAKRQKKQKLPLCRIWRWNDEPNNI